MLWTNGPVANLAHENGVASRAKRDGTHVVTHQHETAATGTFQVFGGRGIGHLAGIEASALISDVNVKALRADPVSNLDAFLAIEVVAVLNGVNESLFERQADAEDLVFRVAMRFQLAFNFFLHAPRFGRIAVDDNVRRISLADVAHGVRLA